MFTSNQKKVAIGIGATALGTILLARNHKKLTHQVSKKRIIEKRSRSR